MILSTSIPIMKVKWDPTSKNSLYTSEFKNNIIHVWSDKQPLLSGWIDV